MPRATRPPMHGARAQSTTPMDEHVEFEFGPAGLAAFFAAPSDRITAREPSAVPRALAALDNGLASGHWIAGYASYELGYALEHGLAGLIPADRRLPLLDFGVFPDGPGPASRPRRAEPRKATAAVERGRLRRRLRARRSTFAPATSTKSISRFPLTVPGTATRPRSALHSPSASRSASERASRSETRCSCPVHQSCSSPSTGPAGSRPGQ